MPSAEFLLSFETPMEIAFRDLLIARGVANVFESRSISEATTPWVEVLFVGGGATGHARTTQLSSEQMRAGTMYDAWNSRLEFTIRTQRQENNITIGQTHRDIIGKIRAISRMVYLRNHWDSIAASQFWFVSEIRDQGSVPQIDDENDLDITVASFSVNHGIRTDVQITED